MIYRLFLSAMSAQAIGLGLGFLTHLSLAWFLDVPTYGLYNFIFSICSTLSMFAAFGLQSSAQRFIPQYQSKKSDQKQIVSFVSFSRWLIFALAIASSFVVFGALWALYPPPSENLSLLYTGAFALAVFLSLMRLHVGLLKGFYKGTLSIVYETVLREALLLIVVWGGWLWGNNVQEAWQVLWIYAGILLALFIGSRWQIRPLIPVQKKICPPATRAQQMDWLKVSAPMMLIITTQMLLHRADIILLGFLVPFEDVGAYALGAKISQATTIAIVASAAIFSPRAAKLYKAKDKKGLKKAFKQTQLFMIGGTTLICLGLLVIIAPLISFLEGYESALLPFYVLMGGYYLNALWGPSTYIMLMTKHEVRLMWMTFGAVLLNIILNIVLVPVMGIVGAAWGTVIALNLRNGMTYYMYRREYQ